MARSQLRHIGIVAACAASLAIGGSAMAQSPNTPQNLDPAEKQKFEDGIRQNIQTYVRLNPLLDASGVAVDVDLTTVTLTGAVPTERDHGLMLQAAQTTYGVYKVVDQLTVREAGQAGTNLAAQPRLDAPNVNGPNESVTSPNAPSMTAGVNLAERPR